MSSTSSERTAEVGGAGRGVAHLHDDQFGGHVVVGAQLLAETQRNAALRALAAVAVEVLQLWFVRWEKNTLVLDLMRFWLIFTDKMYELFHAQFPWFSKRWTFSKDIRQQLLIKT